MTTHRQDLLEPPDPDESAFCALVIAYQEALADGRAPPVVDELSPVNRARLQEMCGLLQLLDRAGVSSTATRSRQSPASERLATDADLANAAFPTLVFPDRHQATGDVPTQPTLVTQGRVGRYQLLRELGRGGMGVVYLARDPELDRLVAIKTLTPGKIDLADRCRFETEGRLLAQQRHPNIVQVYEAAEANGFPYLVMEYVDGPSLHHHLAGQPMEARAAVVLVEALARGVEHAHGAGILHRDLKPANVLLAADGTPKISDFGLATSLNYSMNLTRTGEVLGTPVYMAPEMIITGDSRAGPAVDVYGLGAILYEVLTGQPPFIGVNPIIILSQVQHVEPVAPRRLRSLIPGDLETICLKCLNKDPRRRYASAGALADDLRRFSDGQPIEARPAGPLERTVKFVRRRPAVAAVWGVSVGAVLAIFAIILVFNVRLTEQRNRAIAGESAARRSEQDALITLGLAAEKADNLPEAALRFALAARKADFDPSLVQANRIRWQTYSAANPRPWRAFQVPGANRMNWLGLHPSSRWLIVAEDELDPHWTLWDVADERLIPWPGKARTVTGAVWSPDGRILATASRDGEIQLHLFPEGQLVVQGQAKGRVECLTFDPTARYLALVDGTYQLQVRSVRATLPVVLKHPLPDRCAAIAFSPGATRVGTFCWNRQSFAFALDAAPRLLVGPVKHEYSRAAFPSDEGPGFLSEDEWVTTDGTEVTVWDLNSQQRKKQYAGSPQGTGIAVCAKGQYVVVYLATREPEVWHPADDRVGADRSVRSPLSQFALIRPDGERFLLGSANGLQLWNRDRSPASSLLWYHSSPHPIGWTADGRWFATGGKSGLVRVWRAGDSRPVSATLPVPKSGGLPIAFALCPDRLHLLTAEEGKEESAFQVQTLAGGKRIGPAVRLAGKPTGVTFSPDGRTAYAVTAAKESGWLLAWDWATGRPVFPAVQLSFPPYDVACRPDGAALVLPGGVGDVEMRATVDGSLLNRQRAERPHWPPIFISDRVRFAPDGKTFVTFGRSEKVLLWDSSSGTAKRTLTAPGWKRCVDVHFSPDSRWLATASTDAHQAVVWDLAEGVPAAEPIKHPDFVFTARFDLTGERLVTACRDGKTRIWDWRTGRQILPSLMQSMEVTDAAFSPDGRWVASAESGGRVRLWDAARGLPLAPGWLLQQPGEPLVYFANRLEFTADGRYLLVGVRGRRLLVFDLALVAEPPANLTPDDLVLLGEINAGTAVMTGGACEPLTTDEWLDRWRNFRLRHPEFHELDPVRPGMMTTANAPE